MVLHRAGGPNIVCEQVLEDLICKHKDFLPMNGSDMLGIVVLFTGAALASGGGVGGGGLFIPLLILINEFDPHTAMPISVLMVFMVGVVTTILNFNSKHPNANRPLIDFTVVLYLIPATLLGKLQALVQASLLLIVSDLCRSHHRRFLECGFPRCGPEVRSVPLPRCHCQ
jgi:hypothetical protein